MMDPINPIARLFYNKQYEVFRPYDIIGYDTYDNNLRFLFIPFPENVQFVMRDMSFFDFKRQLRLENVKGLNICFATNYIINPYPMKNKDIYSFTIRGFCEDGFNDVIRSIIPRRVEEGCAGLILSNSSEFEELNEYEDDDIRIDSIKDNDIESILPIELNTIGIKIKQKDIINMKGDNKDVNIQEVQN